MELIVISESKLKITLSRPDMVKYALEGERMDCVDPRTREAFRHIFRDAHAESGFDTEGAPLFIQLYASKGGGCEIFVTKLEGESSALTSPLARGEGALSAETAEGLSEGERRLLERLTEEEVAPLTHIPMGRVVETRMFVFHDLASLLGACRRLVSCGYRGTSAAYIQENAGGDRWYVSLESSSHGDLQDLVVEEYGEACELTPLHLAEHGRVILSEGAVEVLGRL